MVFLILNYIISFFDSQFDDLNEPKDEKGLINQVQFSLIQLPK